MNNENNDLTNMNQGMTPTEVPVSDIPTPVEPVQATPVEPVQTNPVEAVQTTPVVEPAPVSMESASTPVETTPVTPVEGVSMPEVTTPVTPAEEAVAPVETTPVAPVEGIPTPEVTTSVEQPMMSETPGLGVTPPVMPTAQDPMMPTTEGPTMGEQPGTTEEPKKKNNMMLIIIIVAVLLIGGGLGAYFIFSGKDDKPKTNDNDNNTTKPEAKTYEKEKEFLDLAGMYRDAVEKLWNEDKIQCQDAQDATKMLKPSELSEKDKYEGNAYYYVFIDSEADDEVKLDVASDKKVAGWVRIDKKDKVYYVALSDGVNYIIDAGYENNNPFTNITEKDVFTNGNGKNFQYKHGNIYGSNTEGKGWGIGDFGVIDDEDETNDGIYNTYGPKTGGYTPYCTNITE